MLSQRDMLSVVKSDGWAELEKSAPHLVSEVPLHVAHRNRQERYEETRYRCVICR